MACCIYVVSVASTSCIHFHIEVHVKIYGVHMYVYERQKAKPSLSRVSMIALS